METLNEDDLDWLTRCENRLLQMQRREAAKTKSHWMVCELNDATKAIHRLRQVLQARFGKTVDKDFTP